MSAPRSGSRSERGKVRSQSVIDREASVWFARKRLEAPDAFDLSGFETWLEADARHQAAYALMARAAIAVSSMDASGELQDTPKLTARRIWRAVAAPAATAAAIAAAAIFAFDLPSRLTPPARHATAIAQIDAMTLADGTRITLAPASRYEATFSRGERRVRLLAGEAFFEVSADADRPFYVEAGDAVVRVVGTRFNVKRGAAQVRIVVAEGEVEVRPSRSKEARKISLYAGDAAELARKSSSDANTLDGGVAVSAQVIVETRSVPAASAGEWRTGRLSYVEAPLSELVIDLNRYYAPGVALADARLGEYRLTASFEADEIETFFSTLPAVAPLSVDRLPDGAISLSPIR